MLNSAIRRTENRTQKMINVVITDDVFIALIAAEVGIRS